MELIDLLFSLFAGSSVIAIALITLIIIAIVFAIYLIVDTIRRKHEIRKEMLQRAKTRKEFLSKFGLDNVYNVVVNDRKDLDPNKVTYFYLKFPSWQYSNKDGSQDKRRNDNYVVRENSCLYIDNYKVIAGNPDEMVQLVKALRKKGISIPMCEEEKKKYNAILELKRKRYVEDLEEIISRYSEHPTDFELFCADYYKFIGYDVQVTQKSRDGGYDLVICKNNITSLVECKMYSLNNKVSRPTLQKLIGANETVLADELVFITTSSFSTPAIEYASKVDIQLIDGKELMNRMTSSGYLSSDVEVPTIDEWSLTIDDLACYSPVSTNYW